MNPSPMIIQKDQQRPAQLAVIPFLVLSFPFI